jgi:OOP family OmpA-OmpF porin
MRIAAALLSVLLAGPLAALDLSLPGSARLVSDRGSILDSYALPVAPWEDGTLPVRVVEGVVARQSWRIDNSGLTTLQLLAPLRAQIESEGFDILLDCDWRECGGFDFRFAADVIPAPDMHVDVRDYRFLSAMGPGGEAVSLLVSRSRIAGYVQIITVTPPAGLAVPAGADAALPGPAEPSVTVPATGLADTLLRQGHAPLDGLDFETGADDLSEGAYPSLAALAAFMADNPDLRVGLVGHTDAVGGLGGNIALSKRRAGSVRQRLIDAHGIDPARLDAEGMGYLSPIASNLTQAGREANRRVEAILLPGG